MQWTAEANGGFSAAAADDLVSAVVTGGNAPEHVNVSQQRHDPNSLLAFVSQLTRAYRAAPEIGWGELSVLRQPHACVLAHSVDSELGLLVAAHNFAPDGRTFRVELEGTTDEWQVVDVLAGDGAARPLDDDGIEIELEGYGHRWLRVVRPGEKRLL
jgi:hypothetical protein